MKIPYARAFHEVISMYRLSFGGRGKEFAERKTEKVIEQTGTLGIHHGSRAVLLAVC